MISVNRLPLRGKRSERDIMHQNPALFGLKNMHNPLVSILLPVFRANIIVLKFQ